MKTFLKIFKIESRIAYFRTFDSVFFGIIIPVIITLIIGFIMESKPAGDGSPHSFIQLSFGALVTISICSTGIMGFPITIANNRDRKILKRFRVTPVSPLVLMISECLICFILVIISFIMIFTVCKFFFGYTMTGSTGSFIFAYILVILAIYGIGLLLASISRNIKTSNVLSTIVFFPMILFSGATIPYEVMPPKVQAIMDYLPLTQGIKMLKGISMGESPETFLFQILLMTGIFIFCLGLSLHLFKWE